MELQTFSNNLFDLTVKTENGEALFDVETVARSLGFVQTKSGKEYVRWETVNKYLRKYLSQEVGKNDYISEPMVYKLAFKANNALAEQFQDWLATEVLPAIRKHGAYLTPDKIEEALLNPDTLINLATQLKQEREGRLIAEQRVNELTPKASYYDKVLSNKALVTITVIAKDYGMSGKAMNALLHELGVQYKQGTTWLLYARYQKNGWTHSETVMITDKDGNEKAVLNTKWTQKGRLGLYELLKRKGYLPVIERETA
ncbi:phage antirepressor KilAC domain-containing protein [Enterococcus cecorum]|uniref:phage antirepressor KilAC domain-containing protein n=1 Tax=Enterococcus cecorum TaxID=44008 RepID=UPI001FABC6BE|nr:phage antirepressor KilAC domain-containing protein [Enterococcus cecorum]MCJ0567145.1 phage antirepressor KilAC domain-containing protein [Enterococcus cecorum]MCJ0597214.1 phage antirepressor KilAC domain-containing protein [Enterococcus cecorum]